MALASSLDQAGPCARTVLDAALLHATIGGHDPKDSTSIDAPVQGRRGNDPVTSPASGSAWSDSSQATGSRLGYAAGSTGGRGVVGLGAEVVEIDLPHADYALAAYYLILPSECSSNLAKFDGMRYGLRAGDDGQRSVAG